VFKARTAANFTANDVYQVDNARPFADVTIGGVITNLGGGSVSLLLDGTNAPATITPSAETRSSAISPDPVAFGIVAYGKFGLCGNDELMAVHRADLRDRARK